MKFIKILWEFSRPHTIIGSLFSIISLYLISVAIVFETTAITNIWNYWNILVLTVISALSCNIYITGLNQIQDIELDKINKPWLPIPSKQLTKRNAVKIVITAGILALLTAGFTNMVLLLLIFTIMGIGTAYSMPPLKFKMHHIGAAASILLVRGILVNVGMPIQFIYSFKSELIIPHDVWPLTFFVVGFSLAIAWFKDIPDTKGDDQFKIKTLAITISPKAAFGYGVAAVVISYVGLLLLSALIGIKVNQLFFFAMHAGMLLLFLAGSAKVSMNETGKLKKSYLIFWGFFFAEYIIYAASYYI